MPSKQFPPSHRWIIAFAFFACLCAPRIFAAEATDKTDLIKALQSNLCADPALSKKSNSAALESEGVCKDCDVKAKAGATKLKEVQQKAAPITKALDTALEAERIKRDYAYFQNLYEKTNPESLGGQKRSLAEKKAMLEETRRQFQEYTTEKANSLTALAGAEALENGQTELDSEQTKQLQGITAILAKKFEEAEYYAAYDVNSLQKSIEQNHKPGAPQFSKVPWWKTRLEDSQNRLKEIKTKVDSVQGLATWLKNKSSDPLPASNVLSLVKDELATKISKLSDSIALASERLKAREDEVKQVEEKIAELEGKKKNSTEPTQAEMLQFIQQQEPLFRVRIPAGNPGFNPCGMSVAELHAIWNYTSVGFSLLNRALRNGGDEAETQRAFANVLNAALDKLRSFDGLARRGGTLPPEVLEQHKVGDVVTYAAFTSASAKDGFYADHRFVIKSKTGKYIAPFSNAYSEQEVLFKSNTKFRVLSRTEKGGRIDFVLEEVTDP